MEMNQTPVRCSPLDSGRACPHLAAANVCDLSENILTVTGTTRLYALYATRKKFTCLLKITIVFKLATTVLKF